MDIKGDYLVNFRFNLKLLLCANELSAEQLSTKIGLSKGRIGNLACGQTPPTMEDLFALKTHFNVTFNDLLESKIKLHTGNIPF